MSYYNFIENNYLWEIVSKINNMELFYSLSINFLQQFLYEAHIFSRRSTCRVTIINQNSLNKVLKIYTNEIDCLQSCAQL